MNNQEIDKPLCNCGVVGVYNHPQAAVMTYYALHALQHRGQESAGIVASRPHPEHPDRRKFATHKDHGLVLDIFNEQTLTETLRGHHAIGHNRYSTTGSNIKRANIQPFYSFYHHGNLALAHNGNLTNTMTMRRHLSDAGVLFQTTTDTEIILHLIARSREDTTVMRIQDALRQVRGAYSLTILTDDGLIAARDPHGFRPLCIGRKDGAYIVVSETCALDIISAEYVRDVHPNEIILIDDETIRTGEIKSYQIDDVTPRPAYCIFEYVYFSRPDSKIFGHNVDKVRRKLGKRLAEEAGMAPSNGHDGKVVVINVPDSSNTATLGYTRVNEQLHAPYTRYEIGLIRSHYVGRTFISPGQLNREIKVKTKFNVVRGVLEGQQVVVVDDSIVRGTTSKALVNLIKEAKPREVHLRITSPPITHPCKYGMDFPSSEELIANQHNLDIEEIRKVLGVTSLEYLSIEGLLDAVPHENGEGYCTACFTGNYPVEIDSEANKLALEEMG
jgi:amidophosphoribosyltransferase